MGINWQAVLMSKTMWGGAFMFINAIAKPLGYDLGDMSGLVDALVNVIGAGLVIWGRLTATKPLVK